MSKESIVMIVVAVLRSQGLWAVARWWLERRRKTVHRDSASQREVAVQADGTVKCNNSGGWEVDGSWVDA